MKIILSDSTELEIEEQSTTNGFRAQRLIDTDKPIVHFAKSLDAAGMFFKDTIAKINAKLHDDLPDELEVAIGLKVGAEGSVIISKGSAEANISLRAVWKREKNG